MSVKRLLFILTAALLLLSCNKVQEHLNVRVQNGGQEMSFDAKGGSGKISVSSSSDWKASSEVDWVVLGFSSGESSVKEQLVSVWVNPNHGAARSCEVVFYNNQFRKVIPVHQKGASPDTDPDPGPDPDPEDPETDPSTDYLNAPERTIAEFIAEANPGVFRKLSGLVYSFNPSTFEISISDATGSISVFEVVNRNEWAGKIHDNGNIVISGKYHYYAGKRISEVVEAYILSFVPAGGENDPIPVTVAQFKSVPVSETQSYRLAGRVSNIANTIYGNFDLTDESGTLFVYGLTSTNLGYGTTNDKSFASIGLIEGDEIVIVGFRANYNGQTEAKYSYFVEKTGHSFEPGGDDPAGGGEEDTPTCMADFRTKLPDLPQTNADGLTDGSYTWGGLPFTLHADKFYQGQLSKVYYLLIGKENAYILLPVIEGKALKAIKFLTAPQASENIIIDIATADGTRLMVNDSKLKKGTEYKWDIPGEVGTAYKLLITNAYNAQFQYIGLYYE